MNYALFYSYAAKYGYPQKLCSIDDYTFVANFLRVTDDCVVLDVGCGAGLLAQTLQRGRFVVGIDISHSSLATNQSESRVQACGQQLPFSRAVFDRVVFIKTLSLMEVTQSLTEAHRVLKKDGLLMISEQMKGIWDILVNDIKHNVTLINSNGDFSGNEISPLATQLPEQDSFSLHLVQLGGFALDAEQELIVTSSYPSFEAMVDRFVFYSPITAWICKKPWLAEPIRNIVTNVLREHLGTNLCLTHTYKSILAKKL